VIPAIILAAGASSRMGRSKALLAAGPGGPSFVRQIASVLLAGGAVESIVVGRPDDRELREEVDAIDPHVRFVANPHHELGQLSSLVAGLNAADHPGITGILVTPVDVPLIRATTVRTLIDAFRDNRPTIARVTHGASHGHPVIFARTVFDELRRADPAVGAKAVVRAHVRDLINVEVDDAGVLLDIDRPEDYSRIYDRQS
jgi:molybdenum cofactor cytidylyltransferase